MHLPSPQVQHSAVTPVPSAEHDIHVRVSAEFSEMPGLKLTLAQASRLFSITPDRCIDVMVTLVERGVLTTDGHAFARADFARR